MSIADAFNRVRYAAEWAPRQFDPIGFHVPGTDITPEWPRAIASEKLHDLGRSDEGDATLHHDGPLLLHQGKVTKGRYDHGPTLLALRRLNSHLSTISEGTHAPPLLTATQEEWSRLPSSDARPMLPDHVAVSDRGSWSHVHIRDLPDRISTAYGEYLNDPDESPWVHAPAGYENTPRGRAEAAAAAGRDNATTQRLLHAVRTAPTVVPAA